jgi:hypothetical protein
MPFCRGIYFWLLLISGQNCPVPHWSDLASCLAMFPVWVNFPFQNPASILFLLDSLLTPDPTLQNGLTSLPVCLASSVLNPLLVTTLRYQWQLPT